MLTLNDLYLVTGSNMSSSGAPISSITNNSFLYVRDRGRLIITDEMLEFHRTVCASKGISSELTMTDLQSVINFLNTAATFLTGEEIIRERENLTRIFLDHDPNANSNYF